MSRAHQGGDGATSSRRVVLMPTRADVIDACLLTVLASLALIGFHTTFTGWTYLVAGIAGVALGLMIGHLANVLGQPMLAVAAMTVGVFFLLGGAVALRGQAIAGILPSSGTLHDLATVSVHGWKDLLTTLPPVDGTGPLLVLPYILGLLCGTGGYCLARRTRASFAPIGAPFLVVVAVILLGAQRPAAQFLQGAVFAVIALAWAAVRSQRLRPPVQHGAGRNSRLVTAVTLLVVSGLGAGVLGPNLPGAGSHQRLVLRSYVQPPTNIDQYPSPLAAFRNYVKNSTSVLFTVSGLPNRTPMRIATLDDYNGLVWTASNHPGSRNRLPDSFQRVGAVIDNPVPGSRRVVFTVRIPAAGYSGVWLPDVGAITAITFRGPNAAARSSYFRYNLATGTGLVLGGLRANDSFTVQATVPDTVLPDGAGGASVDSTLGSAADFLQSQASTLAGSADSPMARLLAIAHTLQSKGFYSDGLATDEKQYVPGHYQARLLTFLKSPQIVGDDEQYAAAFALLANAVGVPARVVLGAIPEQDGVVRGKDVRAWVEVQVTDGSWRMIPETTFMPDRSKKPKKLPPQHQQAAKGQIVPPPTSTRPHTGLDTSDAADASAAQGKTASRVPRGSGFRLPGYVVAALRWGGPPVGLVLFGCLLIVGLKVHRRRRRRTRGSPATRFAKGWHEIVDHARDLGTAMPGGRTRLEQAGVLEQLGVEPLARTADAQVFGPGQPADHEADSYWAEVNAARRRMSRQVGRWRQLRAAVSIASLRRSRSVGGSPL
jgi:transglutaminase-like putative cysteine protease